MTKISRSIRHFLYLLLGKLLLQNLIIPKLLIVKTSSQCLIWGPSCLQEVSCPRPWGRAPMHKNGTQKDYWARKQPVLSRSRSREASARGNFPCSGFWSVLRRNDTSGLRTDPRTPGSPSRCRPGTRTQSGTGSFKKNTAERSYKKNYCLLYTSIWLYNKALSPWYLKDAVGFLLKLTFIVQNT